MSVRKWVVGWALAGLLVPLGLLLPFRAIESLWDGRVFYVWPSSFLLLGLDGGGRPHMSLILFVYGVSIAVNILAYALAGFLLWMIRDSIRP